jgi:hypothetical protein
MSHFNFSGTEDNDIKKGTESIDYFKYSGIVGYRKGKSRIKEMLIYSKFSGVKSNNIKMKEVYFELGSRILFPRQYLEEDSRNTLSLYVENNRQTGKILGISQKDLRLIA